MHPDGTVATPDDTPQIVVVGSLNLDVTARATRMPDDGETVLGDDFTMLPGGKGGNQAVAAARQEVPTAIIGCIGSDSAADILYDAVRLEGCDARFLTVVDGPSGIAHIEVDHNGDNRIIVVPLANEALTPAIVDHYTDDIASATVLLCQLEVPLDTVRHALELANMHGVLAILNPAPARPLDDEILSLVDLLIPNETEAALLTGIDTSTREGALAAARALLERTKGDVCITRGSAGSLLVSTGSDEVLETEVFPVDAIDATGAGDAFCGGLASAIARGLPRSEAYRYASACGALATTTHGAFPSLPRRRQVEALLGGAMVADAPDITVR